jgi:hypothetical protein
MDRKISIKKLIGYLLLAFMASVIVFPALLFIFGHGFVESELELSPESRLPKWFSLPDGVSRGDVTLTLKSYTDGTRKFTLKKRNGDFLNEVLCKYQLHSETANTPKEKWDTVYTVSTANGIAEIIGHKQPSPVFYISDDPKLRSDIGK